jgi:hypothetical protein
MHRRGYREEKRSRVRAALRSATRQLSLTSALVQGIGAIVLLCVNLESIAAYKFFPRTIVLRKILARIILTQPRLQRTGVNQDILFRKIATFREVSSHKFFPKPIGFRTILIDTILTQPCSQPTGVNQIAAYLVDLRFNRLSFSSSRTIQNR